MENKYLIVVDMQKDFVTGALGSAEARAIVPAVVEKLDSFDGTILFTKDTHHADYLPRGRTFRWNIASRGAKAGS